MSVSTETHRRPPAVIRDVLRADGEPVPGLEFQEYVQPGREAVAAHWLYTGEQAGPGGAEAYLARFGPGAHGDLHRHLGFEVLFIVSGQLENDNGDVYGPGALVVERPGSIHRVSSEQGCVLLVIREKRTQPVTPGEQPEDSPFPMDGRPLR